jgi:hypothetical protein
VGKKKGGTEDEESAAVIIVSDDDDRARNPRAQLPELLCQTGERAYTHLTLKQPTKLLHKYRQADTSIKTNKDEEEVEVPKAHFLLRFVISKTKQTKQPSPPTSLATC